MGHFAEHSIDRKQWILLKRFKNPKSEAVMIRMVVWLQFLHELNFVDFKTNIIM